MLLLLLSYCVKHCKFRLFVYVDRSDIQYLHREEYRVHVLAHGHWQVLHAIVMSICTVLAQGLEQ